MNLFRIAAVALACCAAVAAVHAASPGAGRWYLTDDKILQENTLTNAITEALRHGINAALAQLGRDGGFLNSSLHRIALPPEVAEHEPALRDAGASALVDALALNLNRAAEQAAPAVADLLLDSVNDMQIGDPRSVLEGGDDQVTAYFRVRTRETMDGVFQPLVHDALAAAGAADAYQQVEQRLAALPLNLTIDVDLETYLTEKILDGWFVVIAHEELKLRKDAGLRKTPMLAKVFGLMKYDDASGKPAGGK